MKPSDCHSLNCEIAICALPCLVNKTRYTLFIDSSASNDVAPRDATRQHAAFAMLGDGEGMRDYGVVSGIAYYFLGNHFLVAALLRRPSRTGDN